ncbi:MAG: response regulator [[Eubacterium] rectale]|nr:response regulator [Agathobacter rectalis]
MEIDNLKILICDDSILARKQLKDIILALGTPTFYEAPDGQTAIDTYKKVKPDIVFLDIVMPVKDGNTAIKEIIAFDKDATIFIASSVGSQTQLKSAIESGAKDFIQKPLDTQQVINLIEKYIGGKQ